MAYRRRAASMELDEIRMKITCNLPGDIMITNILPRLPVKSLIRNKIVNKTWYALMENPEFQQMHFDMSSPDHHEGYFHYGDFITMYCRYWVNPNACTKTSTARGGDMGDAIGSANGVICFRKWSDSFGYKFFLRNPTYPREYKAIKLKRRKRNGYVSFGFGYDSRNKDFKIVRIDQQENKVSGQIHNICDLYTNSTNSWRTFEPKIDGLFRGRPCWTASAYVNGSIHWLAIRRYQTFIVSFDLSEEVFREILLPETGPIELLQLHVWKNHLAAIYYSPSDSNNTEFFEIWMMTEYGLKESWGRVCVHGPFPNDLIVRNPGRLMFFESERKTVMYVYDTNEVRHVEVEDFRAEYNSARLDVLGYKESLIKVKGARKMFDYQEFMHSIYRVCCLPFRVLTEYFAGK